MKRSGLLCALLAGALLAGQAQAQDAGQGYIGIGYGVNYSDGASPNSNTIDEGRSGGVRDSHTDYLLAAAAALGLPIVALGIARDDPEELAHRVAEGFARADEAVLVVNVASKCGFTPQYEGLEALQRKYQGRGFTVLGFPCNQFGAQEPGNAEEIANFCKLTYDVSFPLMGKIDVNGPQSAPIYRHLKSEAPGLLGSEAIKWNFTKFLVDRSGKVVKRYAPQTKPEDIERDVEALL